MDSALVVAKLYDELGLSYAILFDQVHFGGGKLVMGYGTRTWDEFAADAPLSDKARSDLVRPFTAERDDLPGMSVEEKRSLLAKTSYLDYLRDYVKVDDQVLEIYRCWGMSFWCVGMDEVPALSVPTYDDGAACRVSGTPCRAWDTVAMNRTSMKVPAL